MADPSMGRFCQPPLGSISLPAKRVSTIVVAKYEQLGKCGCYPIWDFFITKGYAIVFDLFRDKDDFFLV